MPKHNRISILHRFQQQRPAHLVRGHHCSGSKPSHDRVACEQCPLSFRLIKALVPYFTLDKCIRPETLRRSDRAIYRPVQMTLIAGIRFVEADRFLRTRDGNIMRPVR